MAGLLALTALPRGLVMHSHIRDLVCSGDIRPAQEDKIWSGKGIVTVGSAQRALVLRSTSRYSPGPSCRCAPAT